MSAQKKASYFLLMFHHTSFLLGKPTTVWLQQQKPRLHKQGSEFIVERKNRSTSDDVIVTLRASLLVGWEVIYLDRDPSWTGVPNGGAKKTQLP